MKPNPMPAECLKFARRLHEALDAVRSGDPLPPHALGCPECGRRLKLATSFGRALAERPQAAGQPGRMPEIGVIYERVSASIDESALGKLVAVELARPMPAPETVWPLQETPDVLQPQLRHPGTAVPAWLWQHVRADAAHATRTRFRRRTAAAAIAASLALLAVFGWRTGRSEGTTSDIEIVFVPVSELPLAMSPTAVLREGLSK